MKKKSTEKDLNVLFSARSHSKSKDVSPICLTKGFKASGIPVIGKSSPFFGQINAFFEIMLIWPTTSLQQIP